MSFLVPVKNDFLGLCLPLAFWFAMLPDILENKSRNFKTIYNLWRILISSLAVFCNLAEIIKLYQIITDEIFIFDELIRNVLMTTFHTSTLIKCVFLRSELSAQLFKKIITYEKMVYESANHKVIFIYRELLSTMQRTKIYYFTAFVVNVASYILAPMYRDPYYVTVGNVTVTVQQMPVSAYTPLEENYSYSYIWTSGLGAYLAIFFITTDLTINSFIMFGVCQLIILKQFITNFYHYANDIKHERRCTAEESFRILQKELTLMHQDIIRYVKDLNGSLKIIMLIDFVPSSLQMAGMIFQLVTNLSFIQCLLVGQFILTLIARIFIICNAAHDLAVQSESVASTWYDIDWTELPYAVRRDIVFSIVIAQKPLYITFGDLGRISLDTFVVILKRTYSVMTLLTTV